MVVTVLVPTVRTIDPSRRTRCVMARPRAGHRERYTIAGMGTIGAGVVRLSFNRRAAPDGPIESGQDVGERPRHESGARTIWIASYPPARADAHASQVRAGARGLAKRVAAIACLALAMNTGAFGADGDPSPILLPNPAAVMNEMARALEREAALPVLHLDGSSITRGDVAGVVRAMPASFASLGSDDVYKYAMEVLVRQKAMVLNARRQGLDKDPEVLRRGAAALERVMADTWLARQADAAVTEATLRARYARDVAGKPGPDEVRARVILLSTPAEARAAIARLQAGADFATLARLESKDPTASRDGDLGYVSAEAVSPELAGAMFALQPGQIAAYPVHAMAGYYVVRVEARRNRATPGFEAAREKLERELRAEAVRTTIGSLLTGVQLTPGAPGDATP